LEIVRQYTNRLDNFLSSVNAEVIEPDQISHRKLVIKDLARQKPFSPKGRRYRDALIWETVLDTVHRHGEDVVFVTDNNSDFPTEEDGTYIKARGQVLNYQIRSNWSQAPFCATTTPLKGDEPPRRGAST
jgi:hypothetical protein